MSMEKEYDFSNAEQGKFYHPIEELEIPVYLNSAIYNYYKQIAEKSKQDISVMINKILKKQIKIQEDIEQLIIR